MDRLLLFRPRKPASSSSVAAVADGDLLERDVLWPASSAPGLLAALPDDEGSKKKKRAGPAAVRSASRPVPETAPLTPTAGAARSAPVRIPSEAAAAAGRRGRWAAAQSSVGGEDRGRRHGRPAARGRRAARRGAQLGAGGRREDAQGPRPPPRPKRRPAPHRIPRLRGRRPVVSSLSG
ncbi:hypothetical protein OsJ_35275 [Oryza sativa Japonica Group]|uniref:Uncharacterized protein n=1 Tax=Oryza sativa subsp. japonica TaxID=39947 RepID=A3CF36_ORYSJ|nr:hypothetical protein OsJ_35275 [Oryza sativa Japonica Group]